MLALILDSYFAVLLAVATGSVVIFSIGLYFIVRSALSTKTKTDAVSVLSSRADVIDDTDLDAISGEDVISTQLDLARAYVETGKNLSARKILDYVIKQGSETQQDEARELLGLM